MRRAGARARGGARRAARAQTAATLRALELKKAPSIAETDRLGAHPARARPRRPRRGGHRPRRSAWCSSTPPTTTRAHQGTRSAADNEHSLDRHRRLRRRAARRGAAGLARRGTRRRTRALRGRRPARPRAAAGGVRRDRSSSARRTARLRHALRPLLPAGDRATADRRRLERLRPGDRAAACIGRGRPRPVKALRAELRRPAARRATTTALARFAREAVQRFGRYRAQRRHAVVVRLQRAASALAGDADGRPARSRCWPAGARRRSPRRSPGTTFAERIGRFEQLVAARRRGAGWPRSAARERSRKTAVRPRARAGRLPRRDPQRPGRAAPRDPAARPAARRPGSTASSRHGRRGQARLPAHRCGPRCPPAACRWRPTTGRQAAAQARAGRALRRQRLGDARSRTSRCCSSTRCASSSPRCGRSRSSTTCDEVTDFFAPGADVGRGDDPASPQEADVVWVSGHSDYGRAFELFAEQLPRRDRPATSLLVLGDARSNYRRLALPAVRTPGRPGPARLLAQPRAPPRLGHRRLRRLRLRASSSPCTNAATSPNWPGSSSTWPDPGPHPRQSSRQS